MSKMRKRWSRIVISLFISGLLAGCGGLNSEQSSGAPTTQSSQAAQNAQTVRAQALEENFPTTIVSDITQVDPNVGVGLKPPVRAFSKENLPVRSQRSLAPEPVASLPVAVPYIPGAPPVLGPGTTSANLDVAINSDIQNLAASLNNDPLAMYNHVRNNFEFEPFYYGSRKGSAETFNQESGNDFDLATMLIALLRASNIPSHYVEGFVLMSADDLKSWVGVEDATTAADILTTAGYTVTPYFIDGVIDAYEVNHVWVEAAVTDPVTGLEGVTVFDPSFKRHDIVLGQNIYAQAGPSPYTSFLTDQIASSTLEGFDIEALEDLIEDRGEELLQAAGNKTINELVGTKTIIEEIALEYPRTLPLDIVQSFIPFTYDEIAHEDREYIRFQISGLDKTLSLPEIASERILLDFGGLGQFLSLQAASVNASPQLSIGDTVVATGSPAPLGYYYPFVLDFYRGDAFEDRVVHYVSIGGCSAVALDTQRVDYRKVDEAFQSAYDSVAASGDEFGQDILGEFLHVLGMVYFGYQDRAIEYMAGTNQSLVFHRVNEALLTQDLIGSPDGMVLDHMRIDAPRNIMSLFSMTGDPNFNSPSLLLSIGIAGSSLEQAIFELLTGDPSTCTMEELRFAIENEIPVYSLDSNNFAAMLPKLDLPQGIQDAITASVQNGLTVVIPEATMLSGNWYGTGWVALDPDTGAAGYLLSGIITVNGGSSKLSIYDRFWASYANYEAAARKKVRRGVEIGKVFVWDGAISGDFNRNDYGDDTVLIITQSGGHFIGGLFAVSDVRDTVAAAANGDGVGVIMGIGSMVPGPGDIAKGYKIGKQTVAKVSEIGTEAVAATKRSQKITDQGFNAMGNSKEILENTKKQNIEFQTDVVTDNVGGVTVGSGKAKKTYQKGKNGDVFEVEYDKRIITSSDDTVAMSQSLSQKYGQNFDPLDASTKNKGFFGEAVGDTEMVDKKGFQRIKGPDFQDGKTGLDGIYVNPSNGKVVFTETKFITSDAPVAQSKLSNTANGQQLSPDWIKGNLEKAYQDGDISLQQRDNFLQAVDAGNYERHAVFVRQAKNAKGQGKGVGNGYTKHQEFRDPPPVQATVYEVPPGTFGT